jgi:hypothetical protein
VTDLPRPSSFVGENLGGPTIVTNQRRKAVDVVNASACAYIFKPSRKVLDFAI